MSAGACRRLLAASPIFGFFQQSVSVRGSMKWIRVPVPSFLSWRSCAPRVDGSNRAHAIYLTAICVITRSGLMRNLTRSPFLRPCRSVGSATENSIVMATVHPALRAVNILKNQDPPRKLISTKLHRYGTLAQKLHSSYVTTARSVLTDDLASNV